MTALSPFTPEERFESIKAGLTAAVAGLLWAVMSWLGELTYGISVDGFTGGFGLRSQRHPPSFLGPPIDMCSEEIVIPTSKAAW
jgi:hypothetical protein